MTSRERVMAAIRRGDGDYVPCVPHFWSSPVVEGFRWTTEEERLDVTMNRLGADAVLRFAVGLRWHPDVRTKVWRDQPAGERYPLIHKEVTTPKGILSATVRETEDWPHGLDVPFFSDFNVPRYTKPWLESLEDVERFAYVYMPPSDKEVQAAREGWRRLCALRDKFQVAVMGNYATGLTGAIQIFGAQQGVTLSMDHPEAFERYAEIVHEADTKCLEVLLDLKVDMVRRNGWYESTDFWSPAQFRKYVRPYMEKEIAMTHQAGCAYNYTMCTGIMPLLPTLVEMRFDSLDTIEPVLGGQDMARLAKELGQQTCLWGGISAPIHIGEGKPVEVRAAVREAVEILGRRGFILTAVPSIRPHWAWENVMAMLDEWRKVR